VVSYDGQNAKDTRIIILPVSSRIFPVRSFELYVGKVVADDPLKREIKVEEKLQKILDLRKKRLSCLVCGVKTREV
ncbi:3636_t:CDS:2, partial [Scutellospora calospora]